MSSHHIVREGQEPALIIANGETCSNELMGQLLEWSPYIIVLDGALHRVLESGIKFDVLLGDFDHYAPEDIQHLLPPDTLVVPAPDQELSDLEKAIRYLIEQEHKAVNIVWATGKRSDHYMENIATLVRYRDRISAVMLDDYSRIYPIETGFRKHFSEGAHLSLIPLNHVKGIRTSNLVWNLNGGSLEFPYRTGSSNRVAGSGIVSVDFDEGILLLMECTDL